MLPDRKNEIIALVTYIHHKVGFGEPPFSLLDFCPVFSHDELTAAQLPRGFKGELFIKGPYRIVRYRSGSSPSTNRFSIGHEVGHGFLHEEEEFPCKVSTSFSLFKKPGGNTKEWEADFFSAELLMPLPLLNRRVPGLEKLSGEEFRRQINHQARLFGVTPATMKNRLRDLQKMRGWECEFL